MFIIVLLGLSLGSHDPASHHVKAISSVGAICLLVVYLAWVVPYLRADVAPGEAPRERSPGEVAARRAELRRCQWRIARAPAARGHARAAAASPAPRSAFVSDWFINGLQAGDRAADISQAFAGLVIVAIAGNAVENAAGLVLAYKGRSDLAISVVKNSVAQIAAFLFPLLVLISLRAQRPR